MQPKFIPVVLALKDAYGAWQKLVPHIPKDNRYTLGAKIDKVLLDAIEFCLLASYSRSVEKITLIERCIARIDLLQLLLLLSWEIRALNERQYISLAEKISEIGRMLGGWRRQTLQKNPALSKENTGK